MWNRIIGKLIAIVLAILAIFGIRFHKASKKKNRIVEQNEKNRERLQNKIEETKTLIAELGNYEASVVEDFKLFSELIRDIKNIEFKPYNKKGIEIPNCDIKEIEKMSFEIIAFKDGVAALGIMASAGIAVKGVVSVIQKIIKDDTPEAQVIGNVAATGAGIVAGAVYLVKASIELSDDVEKAEKEMLKNQEIINDTISYLTELEDAVNTYIEELKKVHGFYLIQTETVNTIKIKSGSDYKKYKRKEKQAVQNLWLLTELLYRFCQTPILLEEERNGRQVINSDEINDVIADTKVILRGMPELKFA
jgi:hypothetical protein